VHAFYFFVAFPLRSVRAHASPNSAVTRYRSLVQWGARGSPVFLGANGRRPADIQHLARPLGALGLNVCLSIIRGQVLTLCASFPAPSGKARARYHQQKHVAQRHRDRSARGAPWVPEFARSAIASAPGRQNLALRDPRPRGAPGSFAACPISHGGVQHGFQPEGRPSLGIGRSATTPCTTSCRQSNYLG